MQDFDPPSAPTGLNYSKISESSVQVSWTLANETGCTLEYEVKRNGSVLQRTSNSFYTMNDLIVDELYLVEVAAIDKGKRKGEYEQIVINLGK